MFVLYRVPVIGGLETPILEDVDSPDQFLTRWARVRVPARHRSRVARSSWPLPEAALNGPWRRSSPRSRFSFLAPDWSPDGKFVAAVVIDASNQSRSIVLLPVDGGSSRELYRTDSGIGRLRWLPDGSGLLTVISERLERRHIWPRVGRGDLAHRVPRRSSRTPDVRSGQPRSVLPGHRREWQRRRERRQYARVGPLDCAGRSTWTRSGRSPRITPWSGVTAGYRTTTRWCIAT